MLRRILYSLITGFVVFGFSALDLIPVSKAASESIPSASDVVREFQSELLSVMKKANELGYQGRYSKLEPLVKKSHDLQTIARIVTGRAWKGLSDEQRKDFVNLFARLSIATYAHNFDGYSGEAFKFVAESKTSRGDSLVRTALIESDGKEISFDYILRRRDGHWLIINIIADGVSDLALKRSEYTGIIRREGFEALTVKLENKIANYSQAEGG
jgi:phospholipid transport system substrate-binding protein